MEKPDIFGASTGSATNGYVSFEEIENAFKTPTQRQDYYEPKPDTDPVTGDLSHLADPDGSANQPDPEELEAETVVDHDHAMRTGERIARLIDTGIDFTLSNFVARNGESYRADERDLQDIAEAWGEISEEHQWNIGPEWTLAILYVMVYGPLVKQAVADRRMAEMEARQQMMEARLKELENAQANGNPTTIHIDPNYRPKASHYAHQPAPEAPAQD